MEEKVALVEEHRDTYGLNRCLKALDLSEGTWHYQRHSKLERPTKDEMLKERIVEVIKEHPRAMATGVYNGSWLNSVENRSTTRGLEAGSKEL